MPTLAQYQTYVRLPQVKAALDTIAWAEGGKSYQTLYGGGTFAGNQHPNRAITAGKYTSTAAGRYQFLYKTWAGIQRQLGLSDFGPANQDIGAVYLINKRGQLANLLAGNFEAMCKGLDCLWAALPYSTCGQQKRDLAATMKYFNSALAAYGGKAVPAADRSLGVGAQTAVYAAGFLALALLTSKE